MYIYRYIICIYRILKSTNLDRESPPLIGLFIGAVNVILSSAVVWEVMLKQIEVPVAAIPIIINHFYYSAEVCLSLVVAAR